MCSVALSLIILSNQDSFKILFKATGSFALPPVALLRLAVIVLLLITLQMTEVRLTFSLHAEKLGMHGLCGNEFALSFRSPLCFSQSRFPNTIKITASRRCDMHLKKQASWSPTPLQKQRTNLNEKSTRGKSMNSQEGEQPRKPALHSVS